MLSKHHNKHVIDEIVNLLYKGLFQLMILNLIALNLIKILPDNEVVILSAHGSDDRIKDIATQKNMTLVDA
ncbi:hypothetical protein [Spiroplasma endosymbiont of Polydrusus formosus]|uniref:hypothetical protein n=1 Tax=Spiroplasma endosymbiont of Polydrusus formosus TaxID=3139326 RepID=UPI0035B56D97